MYECSLRLRPHSRFFIFCINVKNTTKLGRMEKYVAVQTQQVLPPMWRVLKGSSRRLASECARTYFCGRFSWPIPGQTCHKTRKGHRVYKSSFCEVVEIHCLELNVWSHKSGVSFLPIIVYYVHVINQLTKIHFSLLGDIFNDNN